MNIFILLAIIVLSFIAGTLGRSRRLARKDHRIFELENEMVQAHAELLDMQKEYCGLEVKMKELEKRDPAIPVIHIKQAPKEQEVKKEPSQGEALPRDRSNRTA